MNAPLLVRGEKALSGAGRWLPDEGTDAFDDEVDAGCGKRNLEGTDEDRDAIVRELNLLHMSDRFIELETRVIEETDGVPVHVFLTLIFGHSAADALKVVIIAHHDRQEEKRHVIGQLPEEPEERGDREAHKSGSDVQHDYVLWFG